MFIEIHTLRNHLNMKIILVLLAVFVCYQARATSFDGGAMLDFPPTAAGTCSDLHITIKNACPMPDGNTPIFLAVPNHSVPPVGTFFAWISSQSVASVRYCNTGLTGTVNVATGYYRVHGLRQEC
jgi:hypothetical protein